MIKTKNQNPLLPLKVEFLVGQILILPFFPVSSQLKMFRQLAIQLHPELKFHIWAVLKAKGTE